MKNKVIIIFVLLITCNTPEVCLELNFCIQDFNMCSMHINHKVFISFQSKIKRAITKSNRGAEEEIYLNYPMWTIGIHIHTILGFHSNEGVKFGDRIINKDKRENELKRRQWRRRNVKRPLTIFSVNNYPHNSTFLFLHCFTSPIPFATRTIQVVQHSTLH